MPEHLTAALARRLACILSASPLAVFAFGPSACGGDVVVDGSGGATAGSSTGGAGGAGGASSACIVGPSCTPVGPGPGPQQALCFAPMSGQPCPAADQAQPFFQAGCAAVTSVEAACSGGAAGMCCYNVTASCLCVGRPFLVDGAPRTATALPDASRGWLRDTAKDMLELSPATREALAAAFTEDALGEHASVASFGRFALQLMALGAPAELVAAAHRAALDEVRHAQIAFGLASASLGAPLGPSAFPCATVALRTDPASFARAVAVEGCVGETLAALIAAARAGAATDPRVAVVLASIAEDEARHAELAWQTIAWVLGAFGDEVSSAVFAAFAAGARDALAVRCAPPSGSDLRSFGLLGAEATSALVASGIAGTVEPCVRSLRRAVEAAGIRRRGLEPSDAPALRAAPG